MISNSCITFVSMYKICVVLHKGPKQGKLKRNNLNVVLVQLTFTVF